MNLGLRYDQNQTKDQGAALVGNAKSLSPRLGATYDVQGNGRWLANLSYGHYVAHFPTQIADAASAAGREAAYSYFYQGPSVNDGAAPYKTSYEALQILFDWFNANGGTNRPLRTNPTIPGVNTQVAADIKSSSMDEITTGLTRQLGQKGSVRVDFIFRTFGNIYGDYTNTSTGKVTDPTTGQQFDLTVVDNTDKVHRGYQGMSVQFDYRLRRDLQIAGNWMLSYSKGNVEAEDFTNIVVRASADAFPEYRQARWNYPDGHLNADQRNKVRVWGTWTAPTPPALGRVDLGFMQRFDSGMDYDYNFTLDSRPYVTNPGYLVPPSSVTYYASDRGQYRFNSIWRTDVSVTWNHRIAGKSEVFMRFVMNNVFNNLSIDSFNTTIQGKSGDSTLAAFNPFTETPVEGVHWKKGPAFGQPTGPGSYQSPRDFNVSVGFRF